MLEEKVRSLWPGDSEAEGGDRSADDPGTTGSGPASKLFSCPRCDVVYIALEKEACSSCRGELREVRKTFAHS